MEHCSGGSLGALVDRVAVLPIALVQKFLRVCALSVRTVGAR